MGGAASLSCCFVESRTEPSAHVEKAPASWRRKQTVATGERFISIYQFQTLLTRHAVQYLRPDVCLCGGITGTNTNLTLGGAGNTTISSAIATGVGGLMHSVRHPGRLATEHQDVVGPVAVIEIGDGRGGGEKD